MTNADFLRIIPLGGVGEIGSNFTLFETESHQIVVDYGILFPYDDFFDINYLIVDTSELSFEKETILFITHGHEDHIGAVHHFVKNYKSIQIYAPAFAKELIKVKLEKRKLPLKIKEYDESDCFKFDNYELIPLHVTHSIPDTYGIILKNESISRSVLFISDFKFDLNPLFENAFDINALKSHYTPYKERIAFLDSTNILKKDKTLSESELTGDLEELILKRKRTFITLFSSNLYRVKNILEIAKKHKRKVSTIGRSIQNYLTAATNAGLIDLTEYPIVDFDSIDNYDSNNNIFIVTGSQGEHLGALRRILNGDQKHINIDPKDLFIFSSKPIPGNEKKIYKLYNVISEYGAMMVTFGDYKVHASGHPGQEDLKQLIDIAKPTHYIPIHGETYFLRKHIQFIEENYPNINTSYLENYQGLDFSGKTVKTFCRNQKEPILIHGNDLPIERERISERRKLACNGLVSIGINAKKENVDVILKGLPIFCDQQIPKLREYIEHLTYEKYKGRDHDYTKEQIRIKVRTYFNDLLGYKPITLIHLT